MTIFYFSFFFSDAWGLVASEVVSLGFGLGDGLVLEFDLMFKLELFFASTFRFICDLLSSVAVRLLVDYCFSIVISGTSILISSFLFEIYGETI